MTVLLGLDLSYTAPGIVVKEEDQYHAYFYMYRKRDSKVSVSEGKFKLIPIHTCLTDLPSVMHRFNRIKTDISDIIKRHNVTQVIIEGYAFGCKKSSSASHLYELGGIVRMKLFELGIPYTEIPPTQSKRNFTGFGKASKDDMWETFIKTHHNTLELRTLFKVENVDKTHPVEDIVDAIALFSPLREKTIKRKRKITDKKYHCKK